MKKAVILITALLIIGAWGRFIYTTIQTPRTYAQTVAHGDTAVENELYYEARNEFLKAKEINNDYELELKILDTYDRLHEEQGYIQHALRMITDYPEQTQLYEKVAGKYFEAENYSDLVPFLASCPEQLQKSENLQEIWKKVDATYGYNTTAYADIKLFRGEMLKGLRSNQSVSDEKEDFRDIWVLINKSGQIILEDSYEDLQLSEDAATCFIRALDHKWYSINTLKYVIANNKKRDFEQIGPLSAIGIATAVIDGKYQFINAQMKVAEPVYDYAANFSEGINAVKKGDRWAVVNADNWGSITEYPYEDVAVNLEGCCITNGLIAVEKDKKYFVMDAGGNRISENNYEELKAFESDQPTAYREGDKWGFVNRYGEIYIEAEYEDALPFTNGYAAVKKDGKWGYINQDNRLVVEPQFCEALPIFSSGIGYVKDEADIWGYVYLYMLYYQPETDG